MLQDVEQAVQILAYLECVSSLTRRLASTLTANIDEHGPCLIIEVLVVDPVSLSEAHVPQGEVVVVELLGEVMKLEIFHSESIVGRHG